MTMFLCTSCQYKNPYPWYDKLFLADWRHELKPKLCKCDDEKLVFIDEFIKNYPDLDSTFFETECYSIEDTVQRWIIQQQSNTNRTKYINLFKEGHEIIANYKTSKLYEGKKSMVHYIGVRPTDERGILGRDKFNKPLNDGYSLYFRWRYDEQVDKWILFYSKVCIGFHSF